MKKTPRPSQYTEDIRRLYFDEKLSYRLIADQLDISGYEVRREIGQLRSQAESLALKRKPQMPKGPRTFKATYDHEKMRELRGMRLTYRQIAAELKCHPQTVKSALRKKAA